jgi:hypothetical protein
MLRRVVNATDLVTGLLLIAIAIAALALSWELRAGTTLRMGPGYVPRILAGLLLLLGCIIAVKGLLATSRDWEPWFARPVIWVLAGITYFALSIESLGLVLAVLGLVALSCLGSRETRPVEALLLAVGLAVFSALIFVVGLRLPMALFPEMARF